MIAGVRGQLARAEEQALILDVGGIQLRILAPSSTLNVAGEVGAEVELLTHLVVREDALTLYGFATSGELQLFELLITVNGVGPRVALNLLSFAQPGALYEAIANEDAGLLAKAPGVGKVTAGRIILDLKRKLPDDLGITVSSIDDRDREATEALEALGYSAAEARSALTAVQNRDGLGVEERIIAALRNIDQS